MPGERIAANQRVGSAETVPINQARLSERHPPAKCVLAGGARWCLASEYRNNSPKWQHLCHTDVSKLERRAATLDKNRPTFAVIEKNSMSGMDQSMAESEESRKPIFIGTISYLLSNRNYRDFITGGMNVNQLPLLSDSISRLQVSLDNLPTLQVRHRGGSIAYSKGAPESLRQYGSIEPFEFELQDFFIESVSFESGSVYAKVRVSAFVVFVTAYQGLADYKDVKEGFSEFRSDVIQIVNDAFGVPGAGPIDGQQQKDDAEIRYYFVQPRRLEEEVLKRRVGPKQDQ